MISMTDEERKMFEKANMPITMNVFWTDNWSFITPYSEFSLQDDKLFHNGELVYGMPNDVITTEHALHSKLVCLLIDDAVRWNNEKNELE